MKENKLKSMYGATPQSFESRIRYTLAKAEAAPIRRAPMRTVIIAALIAALTFTTAAAFFSSRAADFFIRPELNNGKIAQIGESTTIGNLTYTLDEVVSIPEGLYGLGRITSAQEGVRILPCDTDPAAFPADNSIAIHAQVTVEGVAVDGGEMLPLTACSYEMLPQDDGSMQFAFILPRSITVTEGADYTLKMCTTSRKASSEDTAADDMNHIGTWQVSFMPVYIQPTAAPQPQATEIPSVNGVQIIMPDGYQTGDALPVYKAQLRTEENSAFLKIDPAHFNDSGIKEHHTRDDYYLEETYVFHDETRLRATGITLEYAEYDGEYTIFYKLDGQSPDGPHPRPAFSAETAELAYFAYYHQPQEQLEKTELNGHTFEEAQTLAASLLSQLDLDDYQLSYALDMTQERIARLGALHQQNMESASYYTDKNRDYSAASVHDEGFFLLYKKQAGGALISKDDISNELRLFVADGKIRYVVIDDLYRATGESYLPEKLLTAEEIIASFNRDNARRELHHISQPQLHALTLCYMPMRAENAADGVIYAPAWYAEYSFTDGTLRDGFAWYSAQDGTLIRDCYTY